jgi:hypothetical protein
MLDRTRRIAGATLAWASCAAALFVLAVAARPASAAAPMYPRLALYGNMRGNGYPLWDSTGTLQTSALDAIARYDEVVIEAAPITPYRPDAIAALRARNPNISMLAYVAPTVFYFGVLDDSLVDIPTRMLRTTRNMNGFLYNKAGNYFLQNNINLAKKDGFGRYVMAESLAVLWGTAVIGSGLWDGIFIDVYCDGIGWEETAGDSIDYVRAGYPTHAAFDAAWRAGTDTLASRLRQLSGASPVLVGNCATGTKYVWFNGWMRENFPYQQGGSWYSNMFWNPGGYFGDETNFRAPQHNYIFSAGSSPPYTSDNARRVRLGLATASLGTGFHVFGPPTRLIWPDAYHLWWYDEYAVDLTTGNSATDRAHTGWLGQPLGAYYQMMWAGPNPDAVTNPGFETDVTSGWSLFSTIGSTVTRDTTTSAVGAASAHVTVPTTTAVPWAVVYTTTGSLTVGITWQVAATFWAKASTPRNITVALALPTSGGLGAQVVPIGTTWKQYQAVIVALGTGPAELQFQCGGEAGDVWLDDCHLQVGSSSVYRRDFQNGTVLVNPSSNTLTVPLEHSFRKIHGTADPFVNDGSTVSQVTIGPLDALFLIGTDQIPPSPILDLRRVP